jgi:hypothetical protein
MKLSNKCITRQMPFLTGLLKTALTVQKEIETGKPVFLY